MGFLVCLGEGKSGSLRRALKPCSSTWAGLATRHEAEPVQFEGGAKEGCSTGNGMLGNVQAIVVVLLLMLVAVLVVVIGVAVVSGW